VLGAASTGVRAMTSSSSPGVSLKSDGISYLAGSDLPAVIINVQRGGPGLGGIQPSQADYWQATKALGHGDFHLLVYAPASVQEMVDMVVTAFDRADKYRMPAMILADGLLGQMMEPVSFPEINANAYDKSSWTADGHKNKRKHHIINSLYLKPDELQNSVYERFERYEKVKAKETDAELYLTEDCDILLCAYGATARVVKSAVNSAREIGIKAGMFRPKTLWPFPVKEINEACKSAKFLLDVEMSMGQMIDDVKLAINCSKPVHFFGRTGGIIPTPAEILEEIKKVGGAE
ncbi:MAG: 3-methyl-2-oxobutanoate dehydrogenase subunit VorB, partial [Ruminococcus sp.]|nr:3-methyl-2-oxobutanoate dehydrogenase subunit VorB [Ruminococcus sp.]